MLFFIAAETTFLVEPLLTDGGETAVGLGAAACSALSPVSGGAMVLKCVVCFIFMLRHFLVLLCLRQLLGYMLLL